MALSLTSITIEFNNMAVMLYERKRYKDAANLFNHALRAMRASQTRVACTQNGAHQWWVTFQRIRRDVMTNHTGMHAEDNDRNCNDVAHAASTFSQPLCVSKEKMRSAHLVCAAVLYNNGLVHMNDGSPHKAREFFQIALTLVPEEIEEGSFEAVICVSIYCNLGLIRYDEGKEGEALAIFKDACQIAKQAFGDNDMVAGTLIATAQIMLRSGSPSEAEVAFDEASRVFDRQQLERAIMMAMQRDDEFTAAAA